VNLRELKKEISVNTKVGLWIDHRKAVVVAITAQGEELKELMSEVEKQPRRSGDSPLKGGYEPVQVPADDSLQRALTGNLNIYYDAVIECVRDAESILIFGPGEAKNELKERFEANHLGKCVVNVVAADKMTDRQIVAKTRQHFSQVVSG
jgi:hypothetical protein